MPNRLQPASAAGRVNRIAMAYRIDTKCASFPCVPQVAPTRDSARFRGAPTLSYVFSSRLGPLGLARKRRRHCAHKPLRCPSPISTLPQPARLGESHGGCPLGWPHSGSGTFLRQADITQAGTSHRGRGWLPKCSDRQLHARSWRPCPRIILRHTEGADAPGRHRQAPRPRGRQPQARRESDHVTACRRGLPSRAAAFRPTLTPREPEIVDLRRS